jgi:dCMP deaminase
MLTTKDIEHLQTAKVVSRMSEDRSTQVGCAIVHPTKSVAVFAANKFPRGVANVEARHGRPQKYLYFEHAERNAIYTMASEGVSTRSIALVYRKGN